MDNKSIFSSSAVTQGGLLDGSWMRSGRSFLDEGHRKHQVMIRSLEQINQTQEGGHWNLQSIADQRQGDNLDLWLASEVMGGGIFIGLSP